MPKIEDLEKELKLYSVQEAMTILKVGKRTIYRWLAEGKIKSYKVGREWRFRPADLEAFILTSKTSIIGDDHNDNNN